MLFRLQTPIGKPYREIRSQLWPYSVRRRMHDDYVFIFVTQANNVRSLSYNNKKRYGGVKTNAVFQNTENKMNLKSSSLCALWATARSSSNNAQNKWMDKCRENYTIKCERQRKREIEQRVMNNNTFYVDIKLRRDSRASNTNMKMIFCHCLFHIRMNIISALGAEQQLYPQHHKTQNAAGGVQQCAQCARGIFLHILSRHCFNCF